MKLTVVLFALIASFVSQASVNNPMGGINPSKEAKKVACQQISLISQHDGFSDLSLKKCLSTGTFSSVFRTGDYIKFEYYNVSLVEDHVYTCTISFEARPTNRTSQLPTVFCELY